MPRWILLAVVAADLGTAGWLRPTDFAPRGQLVEQSPVLSYLAEHGRDQRVQDTYLNLMMLAGAAPVGSYRTVDIPMLSVATRPDPSYDLKAWRDRVHDRLDIAWQLWNRPPDDGMRAVALTDALLGRITYGRGLVAAFPQATTQFFVQRLNDAGRSRAWFWDVRQDEQRFRDLIELRQQRHRRPAGVSYSWLILSPATPAEQLRAEPEFEEYEVAGRGPGVVVVSELGYPGWEARLMTPNGIQRSETDGSESGCRVVQVPEAGRYRLELAFRPRSFERGRMITAIGLIGWTILTLASWLRGHMPRSPGFTMKH